MRLLLAFLALCPLLGAQNAVVILADDLGAVDLEVLSSNGWTPNLDLLAAQGVTFTRAFGAPVCSPAREQLLYGRWSRQGYGTCPDPGPEGQSVAGFWKGPKALLGKWHLSGFCGAHGVGFDWRAGSCTSITYPRPPPFPGTWERWDGCSSSEDENYPPQVIVTEAIDWLAEMEKLKSKGPWLLIIAGPLPHQPFHEPPSELLPVGYPPGGYPSTPPFAKRRAQYEAMVVALDTLVGSVMEKVDLKETRVIFASDNGTPELAVPGGQKAKGTTFERGIRIPLVIAPRAEEAPAVYSELVSLVDVFATLLGSGPDGLDLSGVVEGESQAPIREYVFAGFGEDVCARSARYKLRRFGTAEEFYDLELDPSETINLILEPTKQTLIGEHRTWLDANLP